MISGKAAERIAANHLKKKHYKLLDVNYRSRFGEIDLIFKKREKLKDKYIVFVEVKKRNDDSIAQPKEFVDEIKQRKIIMTATEYMTVKRCKLQPRFDVVEVICKNDKIICVKHLENAFTIS